jgi:hypothetical protein
MLFEQLAEPNPSDRRWGPFFWDFRQAPALAALRLLKMGEPARDYLVEQIKTVTAQQQFVLSILILAKMGALKFVQWDDHAIKMLAENTPFGARAAWQKSERQEAIEILKKFVAELRENPRDKQYRLFSEIMIAYLEDHLTKFLDENNWVSELSSRDSSNDLRRSVSPQE